MTWRRLGRIALALLALLLVYQLWLFGWIVYWKWNNPAMTSFMSVSWSSFFEHPDRESAAQACTDAGLSWHCLSNSAGLILPSAEFRRFWL